MPVYLLCVYCFVLYAPFCTLSAIRVTVSTTTHIETDPFWIDSFVFENACERARERERNGTRKRHG